jgi:hypothetical protein
MLVGLVFYLAEDGICPPEPRRGVSSVRSPLLPSERLAVVFLVMVMLVVALFYIAQSQIWKHVQSLGTRPHRASGWRVDHAGALVAVLRRLYAGRVDAAAADVVALAGRTRFRAERVHEDGDWLLYFFGRDVSGLRAPNSWRGAEQGRRCCGPCSSMSLRT